MNEINSDDMLICQCREGNLTALNTIMDKYKPLVIKKARSMFLIGGETEDLITKRLIGFLYFFPGQFSVRNGAVGVQICFKVPIYLR